MGYVVGRCVKWYYLQEVKSSFSFSYAKPHTFFPTDWRKSKEHWWQPRWGHLSGGKGRECGTHRHGNQGDGQDPPHVSGQRQRLHPSPCPRSCAGLQTQRWPQKVGGAAVAPVSPQPCDSHPQDLQNVTKGPGKYRRICVHVIFLFYLLEKNGWIQFKCSKKTTRQIDVVFLCCTCVCLCLEVLLASHFVTTCTAESSKTTVQVMIKG